MEQNDSCLGRGEKRDNGGMKRKRSKNMYEGPMDMDNNVGIAYGSRRWTEQRRTRGKIATTVIE